MKFLTILDKLVAGFFFPIASLMFSLIIYLFIDHNPTTKIVILDHTYILSGFWPLFIATLMTLSIAMGILMFIVMALHGFLEARKVFLAINFTSYKGKYLYFNIVHRKQIWADHLDSNDKPINKWLSITKINYGRFIHINVPFFFVAIGIRWKKPSHD